MYKPLAFQNENIYTITIIITRLSRLPMHNINRKTANFQNYINRKLQSTCAISKIII